MVSSSHGLMKTFHYTWCISYSFTSINNSLTKLIFGFYLQTKSVQFSAVSIGKMLHGDGIFGATILGDAVCMYNWLNSLRMNQTIFWCTFRFCGIFLVLVCGSSSIVWRTASSSSRILVVNVLPVTGAFFKGSRLHNPFHNYFTVID